MTLRLEGGFLCISRATRTTFGCLNCQFELEAVIVLAKDFNFSVLDKSLFWKILDYSQIFRHPQFSVFHLSS